MVSRQVKTCPRQLPVQVSYSSIPMNNCKNWKWIPPPMATLKGESLAVEDLSHLCGNNFHGHVAISENHKIKFLESKEL